MDYLLNCPVYFMENRERKNVYFVPKWTKPMAACSPKSHRTFRILFTLLHTIKTACKVFTLLCCNLKISKKKKTVTQKSIVSWLREGMKEGEKIEITWAVAGRFFIWESTSCRAFLNVSISISLLSFPWALFSKASKVFNFFFSI